MTTFIRPLGVLESQKRMITAQEKRRLELLKQARESFDQLTPDNDAHCDLVAFERFLESEAA